MRRFIRRICEFDSQDWKHCRWLVKEMIQSFLFGDFDEYKEAKMLLHLHLFYDHS